MRLAGRNIFSLSKGEGRGEVLRLSEVTEDDFDLADGEEALLRTVVGIGEVAHELGTATHPVRKAIECRPRFEVGCVKHG